VRYEIQQVGISGKGREKNNLLQMLPERAGMSFLDWHKRVLAAGHSSTHAGIAALGKTMKISARSEFGWKGSG